MRTRVTTGAQPATDVRFCLVFPRETVSIPVMRQVLGDTFRKLGLREDCISDLLLAVTEACTNVLRHSGPGRGYEVVAIVGRNRCVLEVVDDGRGFDPVWLPARRAAQRSVSRLRRYGPVPAPRLQPPAPGVPPAPAGPAPFAGMTSPGNTSPGSAVPGNGNTVPANAVPANTVPANTGPGNTSGAGRAGIMPGGLPARSPLARVRLSRMRRGAQRRVIARLPESGRGLAIMRAFVDDVTLQSRPGHGTVVWLAKEIELRSDAPLARPEAAALRDAG